MRRVNLFIDEHVFGQLKEFPGTISERIRIAIYEHLQKLNKVNVSASQSQPCKKCKTEIQTGSIICPACGQHDPVPKGGFA